MTKIIEEGLVQERLAEKYVVDHIEAIFPEICKAIQLRRAKFQILHNQYRRVEDMVHYG